MTRSKTVYECATCGEQAPKWVGRCGGCGHWNSMIESAIGPATIAAPAAAVHHGTTHRPAVPLDELDQQSCVARPTGIDEFDRVLGGGLVAGSITLVGGEPGVGKSTLLSQVAAAWACRHSGVLSVSAEESPQQVGLRFHRLGLAGSHVQRNVSGQSSRTPSTASRSDADYPVHVGGDCNIDGILADLATLRPGLAIIDSIQTVFDPALASAPGSVAQVRQCAHRLSLAAREHNCAVVLVGQVTKDGSLAGPRVLEHLVDSVLSFDGERELGLRVLRALKHRFGPTGELGVFEMTGAGLVTVDDPSGRMLVDRQLDAAGSAVAVTVEGRRAVVLEVQALLTNAETPNPRRSASGFDQKRMAMLLAVLQKHLHPELGRNDAYLSVVGGLRIGEPGADLAVCAAIHSSLTTRPIPPDLVAIGEVGLAGELRSAAGIERRLGEAARLGFRRAVVPQSDVAVESSLRVIGASNLQQALGFLAAPAGHLRLALVP